LTMKSTLQSLDEAAKMDENIIALVAETERLIALMQPQQGAERFTVIMESVGDYYASMDSDTVASKQLMNNSIDMSNTAIEQAGTLHLTWKDIEIEDGRVYLAPTLKDIVQAARTADQMENNMESLLSDTLTSGLEGGIISSVTFEMPNTLENAVKTGATLDQNIIQALANNNIERINLDLGAMTFGIDNRFFEEHPETNFEFNVVNEGTLSDAEKNRLPEGTSDIGAPVLNLSTMQNNQQNDEFKRPVDITFDLSFFDFKPKDGEQLFIGRWNTDTEAWEKVGGRYDPVTNSITTARIHLSKYTVLKSEKSYSDIEDSWAKNEIAALKGKGIIEEKSLFNGNEEITREEFACWVSKAYGLDATTATEDQLTIDPDSDYYNELVSLYDSSINTSGSAPKQLVASESLSREELAVVIANALDTYDRPVDTGSFELAQYEEDLPTWAVDSVETVVENGIVDESFFGSAEAVTREEAANILYQVYR